MAAGQLTAREHQQRVNAARARWAAAGLGAAAGGAAAFHVAQKAKAAVTAGTALAGLAAQAPEIRAHQVKMASLALRERLYGRKIANSWPVPAMRAVQFQTLRDAQRHFRTNIWENPHFNGAPVDQDAWEQAAFDAQGARETLAGLAGSEPKKRKPRAGRTYTLASHQRKAAPYDPKKTKAYRDADAAFRGAKRELRDEFEAQADGSETPEATAAYRRMEEAAAARKSILANLRAKRGDDFRAGRVEPSAIDVSPEVGKVHVTRAHRVTVTEGSHTPAQLAQMRDSLRWRLATHFMARQAAERARHASAIDRIRAAFRPKLGFVSRVLMSRHGLAGLAAAGAVVGGTAVLAATHTMRRPDGRLSKADDAPGDEAETADHLDAAAKDAEGPVAANLAGAFRMWKDDATRNLFSPRERALLTTMHTDLARATSPLDTVMERAIAAPVHGVALNENGTPSEILLATEARGPAPEAYVAQYRRSRIAELTNQQRDTIRDLLIQQARAGTSPDTMARRIRDVIGLTREQAQHVLNYRDELERLDPGALDRQLRDKRYDGPIGRAIDGDGTLSRQQIDKAVDAYHRKYLAYRAMTIARTESVGAANNGHVAAVRSFLNQHDDFTVIKTWNAKMDSKTRPDHRALHGTSVVGIDTPFRCLSGDRIAWPHQPGAPARAVINCRCYPEMRLVPRTLAAQLGPKAVRPLEEDADA